MKKIIFLCAMLCTILSVKSQCFLSVYCDEDSVNMRQYEDRYLFNYCRREGINLDVIGYNYDNSGLMEEVCATNNGTMPPIRVNMRPYNIMTDFAQPYIVDTPITIAGVSGYVFHFFDNTMTEAYNCYRWYFEIWDSTFTNILRSVDVTGTLKRYQLETPRYTEAFFDEPLTISGKFYVVYHTPDTLRAECPFNSSSGISVGVEGVVIGTTLCSPCTELYPLATDFDYGKIDNTPRIWRNLGSESLPGGQNLLGDTITMLYLFPILADTTSGSDTIVSNLENINNLESVRVFPNPTENEVNINSGYRIERIFLYDESGKLLQEKEVKAYNYKIDLHYYPQGSYLLKVQTSQNQTTLKIIRQ